MTSEGHPGARLQRALAAGNLIAAEQAAFEIQFIPLADARALVELYAEKGDRKYERAALTYLGRYLTEADPSLTDVAQVAALLAERWSADARAVGGRCARSANLSGAATPSCHDPFVQRFVYKIEPASLIPGDAEYMFESEEDLKAGEIFERVGRHLFIERVEDDDSDWDTETSTISRTLHCRLEIDPDAWPGEEDWAGD